MYNISSTTRELLLYGSLAIVIGYPGLYMQYAGNHQTFQSWVNATLAIYIREGIVNSLAHFTYGYIDFVGIGGINAVQNNVYLYYVSWYTTT